MSFFRKILFPAAIIALLAFASLLSLEAAHHHGAAERTDNCSLCSWQQTGSHVTAASVTPTLILSLVVLFLFFREPSFHSFVQVSPRGRSPPQNLL